MNPRCALCGQPNAPHRMRHSSHNVCDTCLLDRPTNLVRSKG